jgi:hypothetical protein
MSAWKVIIGMTLGGLVGFFLGPIGIIGFTIGMLWALVITLTPN